MLDFKYFCSAFYKVLKSYLSIKDSDISTNQNAAGTTPGMSREEHLETMEKEIYRRHSQLMSLKNDIYKNTISYCNSLRLPDELLMNAEDALNIKEELLSEILPLYFLSGIMDIPLRTKQTNLSYDDHLRLLYDYFTHKIDGKNAKYDSYHEQTLDEYVHIISHLVKFEDYDHFQSSLGGHHHTIGSGLSGRTSVNGTDSLDDVNFNSFPKLALHLLSILECKYPQNLFPRTCYRIIRTLCKRIEVFGCYDPTHNELLRISLKKLALHSPEFFNNLSFYQLLSMCYVNIEGAHNHFIMDNVCNKLLEMKYKMLGGQLNSADLSFLCNTEHLMYWLHRIIDQYHRTNTDNQTRGSSEWNEISLKSMDIDNVPISVLGYDGMLFILLKYFDNLTHLNRTDTTPDLVQRIESIVDDILVIYHHNHRFVDRIPMRLRGGHSVKKMEHWTLCCALNFVIKKCAEFGNRSNGTQFGAQEMLQIMTKIASVGVDGNDNGIGMVYDVNGIKKALSLAPAQRSQSTQSTDGSPGGSEDIDVFGDWISSWWKLLNQRNVSIRSNTWLMLSLSTSVGIIEKEHFSLFDEELKRKMKYEKKVDYRCLRNVQSELSPLVFFSKNDRGDRQYGLLRQSAQRKFEKCNEVEGHYNLYDVMAEGMLMNLNSGKKLYLYFQQKWRPLYDAKGDNVSGNTVVDHDKLYSLFRRKLDFNEWFNIIPFFNNLHELLPSEKFGHYQIGKMLTMFRKTRNVDLSLSLFESLSFKKKYGATTNELLSILILTLIENGRLEAAKYWIERYLHCFPILGAQLIDHFFAEYMTYSMTAPRSRRCQGRDRQILKSFYDHLMVNRFKDHQHRNVNVSFDKLLFYSIEYSTPEKVAELIADSTKQKVPLNSYKTQTECIEEVMVSLMTNNRVHDLCTLLRALYLCDGEEAKAVFDANIEIMVRSFFPVFRFLANHDEWALIGDLFRKFEAYNERYEKHRKYSIPISAQKVELLFDDQTANLPVLKDFDCLKMAEKSRSNSKTEGEEYHDPGIEMVRLWKDFYFDHRHTDKALIQRLYHYFVRRDQFLFDRSHFLVSKDINVRFAQYFMMNIVENEEIFKDGDRHNVHFQSKLKMLMEQHFNESYQHCAKFTKAKQRQDLQAVLRAL